ncbi:MAG: hypothetical protein ABSE90_00715 [Verrucomicrobiota bacterium]|jgi:hypothetical protein
MMLSTGHFYAKLHPAKMSGANLILLAAIFNAAIPRHAQKIFCRLPVERVKEKP